jgi:endonuclease-8
VPEGDTIFRAARTLHRALAGRTVTEFESVYPRLTRVDHDTPLAGRTIEAVSSRGKHLLMAFSGDLILHTHMRMHGSWHIYRPGERWRARRRLFRTFCRIVSSQARQLVPG